MATRLAVLRRARAAVLGARATRAVASRAEEPQINEALLKHPSVRLISETGTDRGLMSPQQALDEARTQGKDLLQITLIKPKDADSAPLPIVRILDYASFEQQRQKKRYQQQKATKQRLMEHRKQSVLKQIRFSPLTDRNDMRIKLKHAAQFLIDGYRVKIYVQFKRGQGNLKASATQSLINAALVLAPFGNIQGLKPSASIQDLFISDDEQPPQQPPQHKPLELVLQPLPKTQRDKLSAETLSLP